MSSSSLSSLVNQLHSMEHSFAQILMEATMRLSTLTDASVFLLLETPEGRRYCGKRHLCDTYKMQGLCPMENELEMELVPGVSTLQVRRQPPFECVSTLQVRRQPPFQQTNSSFSQPQSSSSSSSTSLGVQPSLPIHSPPTTSQPLDHDQQQHHHHNQPHLQQHQVPMVPNLYASSSAANSPSHPRKRSNVDDDSNASHTSSPRKLLRSSPSHPIPSQQQQLYQPYAQAQPMPSSGLSPGASAASSISSMIPDAASTSGGDDGIGGGGGGGIGGGGGDVGIRFINTDAPISSCEDEGGEVVFVDVKREDGGTRRCNANAGTESYLDDQTGDTVQKMDGLQMTTATSSQMANALGCKGDVFLDSFARKAAVDQLSLEEKLEIMKGLSPDSLLKPGAVDTEEYLIFQKVCYEFCRACALECPMEEADVDAYFDASFNAFTNVFPKLNTNVDVLYHMRLLTKRSYKQYLKTRGKRKNDHSKMATFFS